LGAVVEGSPLWNLVDADRDNRLSIRERTNVISILTGLDQNNDGMLSTIEIPTRIRLAVALGSNVHSQLAENIPPIRRIEAKPSENAPAWFLDMDLDHDGEISEKEFIGDPAKFKELDLNKDSRISIKEGLQVRP
jgi:Ca2+-binding EF-hand superfamily protein